MNNDKLTFNSTIEQIKKLQQKQLKNLQESSDLIKHILDIEKHSMSSINKCKDLIAGMINTMQNI